MFHLPNNGHSFDNFIIVTLFSFFGLVQTLSNKAKLLPKGKNARPTVGRSIIIHYTSIGCDVISIADIEATFKKNVLEL